MGLIQRADLAERIRRAFGIREAGVGTTLSAEIVPVVVVEDLTGPAIDQGYPRLCCGEAAAGASVGVMAESFLINPPNSRVDLIVHQWWTILRSGTEAIVIRTGTQAILADMIGTTVNFFNFDLRTQLRPGAYCDTRNEAAAIGTVLLTGLHQIVDTWYEYPFRFTIPPGEWISVAPSTNNRAVRSLFLWEERLRTTT